MSFLPENEPQPAMPAAQPSAPAAPAVAVTDPTPAPQPGAMLGSYRLVKLLGEGGMGRVYVAEHQALGRKVALKLLLPQYSKNPDIVQRFFNEARAVNQINHPNIVEIVDFVQDPNGFNYFIMELLDGRDLRKVREEEGHFLVGRTVSVGKQMASALAAAHAKGIVHRDIKPDNVLLLPSEDRPNFIKLLDFGIAKLTSAVTAEQKTRVGMVLGTPGYMSPEQAFGRPIDGRSDIYALGVLLYWMLLDELPGNGNLPMKSQASAEAEPPVPLRVTKGGQAIAPALARLVERCLAFDPDQRVQSMQRVREELAALTPAEIGDSAGTPAPTEVDIRSSPPVSGPLAVNQREVATRLKPSGPVAAIDLQAEAQAPAPLHAGPITMQAQAAALGPKRSGAVWIGVAAAALTVGIGLFFVLRQGEAPAPMPEAPAEAKALPAPQAPEAKPASPLAPVPAPAPQLQPVPAPPKAAEQAPPKPAAPKHKAVAKKAAKPNAPTDETQIIDPLAE